MTYSGVTVILIGMKVFHLNVKNSTFFYNKNDDFNSHLSISPNLTSLSGQRLTLNWSNATRSPSELEQIQLRLSNLEKLLYKKDSNLTYAVRNESFFINRKQAINLSGGQKAFHIITHKYNVKPIIHEHKLTLYWREDIERACLFFKNAVPPLSTLPTSVAS